MNIKKIIKNKLQNTLGITEILNKQKKNQSLLNEILWAQVFKSNIENSEWFIDRNLNPGRWAVNYSCLFLIYNVLNKINPLSILEFGLGESSKLTMQYANYHKDVKLKIVEHNSKWIDFFSYSFPEFNPKYILQLPLKEIEKDGFKSNSYDNLIEELNFDNYDFVIVDGPYGTEGISRYNIIELVENTLLKNEFVILIDDYNRKGEQKTVQILFDILKSKKISFVFKEFVGEKSQMLIAAENYNFMTSI